MTMLTTLVTQLHPGPWQDGVSGEAPAFWPVFPITFGLFWVAVALGVFYLVRRRIAANAANAKATAAASSPMSRARGVLAERFARGEIDEDEYLTRMAALRDDA